LGYTADGSGSDLILTSSGSGPTNITVSNGQTSNGLVITSGETLTVLASGTVNNTILNGGFETDGGAATGTIVSSDSRESVASGGSTLA
jgi:autotransporter passenger strand-loop-strand repeat protein